jgi:hypothetical protein
VAPMQLPQLLVRRVHIVLMVARLAFFVMLVTAACHLLCFLWRANRDLSVPLGKDHVQCAQLDITVRCRHQTSNIVVPVGRTL